MGRDCVSAAAVVHVYVNANDLLACAFSADRLFCTAFS